MKDNLKCVQIQNKVIIKKEISLQHKLQNIFTKPKIAQKQKKKQRSIKYPILKQIPSIQCFV